MGVLTVDWGGYKYKVKLKELKEQAGCEIFISQAGGEGTPDLIKEAKDLGYITGTYGWQSALQTVQSQVDWFSALIEQDKPDFFMVDFEHFWASWAEHNEWVMGQRKIADVRRIPGQKISDSGQMTCEMMHKRWILCFRSYIHQRHL